MPPEKPPTLPTRGVFAPRSTEPIPSPRTPVAPPEQPPASPASSTPRVRPSQAPPQAVPAAPRAQPTTPEPTPPEPTPPAARRASTKKARSPFVWLRRLLLIAGITGVVTLGVLLLAYRFGASAGPSEESTELPGGGASVSEDINWTQTVGGETVFQVKAKRLVEERDGGTYLQDVALTVPRADGQVYTIRSERATVDREKHEATLEGAVKITGWGDLVLESRSIRVLDKGSVMRSDGTVEFHADDPQLDGRASSMIIDKNQDTVLLNGGVHLRSIVEDSGESMKLDSQKLIYQRADGLLQAMEDVKLQLGDQLISAHTLSLFMYPDRSLRLIRARWQVEGSSRSFDPLGGETYFAYSGQFLEIKPGEANPDIRKITLEGTRDEHVKLTMREPDGLVRDLSARKLHARMVGSLMNELETFGDPVTLTEYLDMPDEPFPLRKICAGRLVTSFEADGSLGQLYLQQTVDLSDREINVSGGEEAYYHIGEGRLEIQGPEVFLSTERGDLAAPFITYSRDQGLVKASRGVLATLEEGEATSLSGTPLAQGDGPVRIAAREAVWTQTPSSFVFRDDVRAWRGQNLILSQQLRGDEGSGEMSASGGVTTVWVPPAGGASLGGLPQRPIEVRAATLSFRRSENSVIYSGGVNMTQDQRSLDCSELTVHLLPGGSGAERMVCRGDVKLDDPVGQKKVTGERAIYDVAADSIEVLGERVYLVDGDGNELVGRYLRYDLESGDTRLSSTQPGEQRTPSPSADAESPSSPFPSSPTGNGTGTGSVR